MTMKLLFSLYLMPKFRSPRTSVSRSDFLRSAHTVLGIVCRIDSRCQPSIGIGYQELTSTPGSHTTSNFG